jgi:hypothetical protein
MKQTIVYFYLFFIGLFLLSCGNNKYEVEVTDIVVPDITINRLEQDVFTMDTTNIATATKKLEAKYGNFYSSYITGILNNGGKRDSSYATRMKSFIRDRDMQQVYAACQKTFPSTDSLKEQFLETFKYYKHYFPNKKSPKVITMMSGFNYNVVLLDNTLAIGLEMYLGSTNEFYQMLALPRYRSSFMNKENILPDAVRSWMLTEYPYMMDKSDFLSQIIYMGKIMYLGDLLLPNVQDTLKVQYSQKQMDYCNQNEFNVWSYFAAQKMLYTTDQTEIMKFTSEGPFTSALSKEAPPRIGYWIGWQIVRQYMDHNPTVTVEQLMKENDAQQILSKAKYKPRK